jgi:hypothetical protein
LRAVELLGCAREAALANDGEKDFELREFHSRVGGDPAL